MSGTVMGRSERLDKIVQIGEQTIADQQAHDDMVIIATVAIMAVAGLIAFLIVRKSTRSE